MEKVEIWCKKIDLVQKKTNIPRIREESDLYRKVVFFFTPDSFFCTRFLVLLKNLIHSIKERGKRKRLVWFLKKLKLRAGAKIILLR